MANDVDERDYRLISEMIEWDSHCSPCWSFPLCVAYLIELDKQNKHVGGVEMLKRAQALLKKATERMEKAMEQEANG